MCERVYESVRESMSKCVCVCVCVCAYLRDRPSLSGTAGRGL